MEFDTFMKMQAAKAGYLGMIVLYQLKSHTSASTNKIKAITHLNSCLILTIDIVL